MAAAQRAALVGTIAIVLSFFAIPAFAQTPSEANTLATARGLGMGTGARSTARGGSAVAYNPAGMAGAGVYQIESIVDYNLADGSWSLGGVAIDAVTSSRVAAGFSGRGVIGGGDDAYNGYDLRLALAMPLMDIISIGVTGRFARLRRAAEVNGEPQANENLKHFTMDASIVLRPADGFSIAALGYNLIDTRSGLAPRLFGGSIGYQYESTFSIGADLLVDLESFESTEYIAGGGIEYLAGDAVPLRFGYEHDTGRETHTVAGGIGYVDNNMGLEFSFRQGVSGNKDTRLLLSFRYHVQ